MANFFDEELAPERNFFDEEAPTDTSSIGKTMDSLPGGFFGPRDIVGDLEAGVSMLSAAPGELARGLTYVGTLAGTLGNTQAAKEVSEEVGQKINDKLQYQPRSARGKEAMEALGWGSEELVKGAGALGAQYGGNLGELGASVGTEFALELLPLGPAVPRGGKGKKVSANAPTKSANVSTKLDEIVAKRKSEETPSEVSQPMPTKQGELDIPYDPGVDLSGVRNPYDTSGRITEIQNRAPRQGEIPLQTLENQTTAYEQVTGHKTEAPESPRINSEPVVGKDTPEVTETALEPALVPSAVSEEFIRSQSTEQGGWVNPFGKKELPAPIGRELTDPNQKWGLRDSTRSEADANNSLLSSNAKYQRFGNKQKGVIDLDLLTGGISKLAQQVSKAVKKPTDSTSPLSLPERQAEVAANVPGWEDLKDWVAKDADPSAVITEVLAKPDLSSAKSNFIAGTEMFASIRDNPATYAIDSWLGNAHKRADLYASTQLKPLQKKLNQQFTSKEAPLLQEVLKKEMVNKIRFTEAELQAAGMSPKGIDTYLTLRSELDVAYQRQNEALAKTGQKGFSPEDAYVAAMRSGDWKAKVYNKEGKVVWFIAEHSKAKANHAINTLIKNNPELDSTKRDIFFEKQSKGDQDFNPVAEYNYMLKALGENDPLVQSLKQQSEQSLMKEGSTALGQNKHFLPKAGYRGYLGDRPWVNDAVDTKAFFTSQMRYLKSSHTFSELQGAIDNISKITQNEQLQASHPQVIEWTKNRVRQDLGRGTKEFISKAQKYASEKLGDYTANLSVAGYSLPTDVSSVNRGNNFLKQWFYITKLGVGNLPFAAMSLVQPVFTIPHQVQLLTSGHRFNPLKSMGDSMLGTAYAMGEKYGKIDLDPKEVPQIFKDGLKYAKANNVVSLNQFSEIAKMDHSAARTETMKALEATISEPEFISRSGAFFSFVSSLEQSGKYKTNLEIFQKAEELTQKAMANYRHTQKADIFNKTGILGSAASTLWTFKMNQFNQLYDFGLHFKRTGDPLPLMSMLGIQFGMAGAMGMYGLDDIEEILNFFKTGYAELGGTNKGVLEFSPKDMVISSGMPPWASMGLPSELTGRDISSRLSSANLIDTGVDKMIPYLSDYGAQAKAVGTMLFNYNAESRDRALMAVAPASLKSVAEMNLPTTTGPKGQAQSIKTGDNLFTRTPEDIATKNMPFAGMNTRKEGALKSANFRLQAKEKIIQRAITTQNEKLVELLDESTPNPIEIRDQVLKLSDLGGNVKTIVASMPTVKRNKLLDIEQKLALKAGSSKQAFDKYKRYKDMLTTINEKY